MKQKMLQKIKLLKIKHKLILAYVLFAIVPMLLITIYSYRYTQKMLLSSMKNNIETDLNQITQEIEGELNRYDSVLNILYSDKVLHNYLCVNYTEIGYEDLYYYINQTFNGIELLYPDLSNIQIYSTNDTLFHDEKYIFPINNTEEWYKDTIENAGKITLFRDDEKNSYYLSRWLNLYETGNDIHIVKIEIPAVIVDDYLTAKQNYEDYYLINTEDKIITCSDSDSKEEDINTIINEAGNKIIVMEKACDYFGKIYMTADWEPLNQQARRGAVRILLIFMFSSVLAIICISIYSTYFQKNVMKVMKGAKKIGEGDFSYRIENVSKDEIGEIADSVNRLGGQIDSLIKESYEKEIGRRKSDFNLLQEQINPHFLYNALSSISALAMKKGNTDVMQAIASLADFYRISLNKGKTIITIREEIQLLESYLKVQRMRFGNSIKIDYDLDETLLDDQIIKLILQPVVENAIHHGRDNDDCDFHISVRLFQDDQKHIFEIEDDGCGIQPEDLCRLQESLTNIEGGFGLRNVNFRIKLQYGEEYGVVVESEYGFGTMVRIEMP